MVELLVTLVKKTTTTNPVHTSAPLRIDIQILTLDTDESDSNSTASGTIVRMGIVVASSMTKRNILKEKTEQS